MVKIQSFFDRPIEKNNNINVNKNTEISSKIYFKLVDSNPKSRSEIIISLDIKPFIEDRFKRFIKTDIEVKKKGSKKVCKAINGKYLWKISLYDHDKRTTVKIKLEYPNNWTSKSDILAPILPPRFETSVLFRLLMLGSRGEKLNNDKKMKQLSNNNDIPDNSNKRLVIKFW